MDDLVDLSVVVRRVVAARVRDTHLVEDLTQEALVHVAAADPRLSPSARQAYAIVTARNVIVSHARAASLHERHAHRLVDYTTFSGPEQLTLEQEETDALATALQHLAADERDLLLRHEAGGTSLEALAEETGISSGAIGMRLARARATLRLEFLLVFRRVELPTQRCRPVLLALSAGDRRRQDSLDAAGHLVRCWTCAQLAEPVTERRRGIAAWLFVPAAEAVRRTARSLRHNPVTQVVTASVVVVAIVATAVATRSDDPPPAAAPPPVTTAAAEPAPASVVTTEPAPPLSAAATPTPSTSRQVVTTTAAVAPCPAPAPLDELEPALDCPFGPTTLTVTDVPADEGFWAETATADDVWVQLTGDGESPVDIAAGRAVVVVGTVADPAGAGPVASDPRVLAAGYILQVRYSDVVAA